MSTKDLIFFRLTSQESALLVEKRGDGGFEDRFGDLTAKFDSETGTIWLNDEQLGMILRHLSYGKERGGYQRTLEKIFWRSIENLKKGVREKS